MGAADKAKNEAKDLQGKAKEAAGNVTDNDRLVAEGKITQAEADARKAAERGQDNAG